VFDDVAVVLISQFSRRGVYTTTVSVADKEVALTRMGEDGGVALRRDECLTTCARVRTCCDERTTCTRTQSLSQW
jgi:hypothetical protein